MFDTFDRNQSEDGVYLTMRALKSCLRYHSFTFAIFLLGDQMKYLLGHKSSPADFLSKAAELCAARYLLVGIAVSQDFDNWATVEFHEGNCSLSPGFVQQALHETLTIIRSNPTSSVN